MGLGYSVFIGKKEEGQTRRMRHPKAVEALHTTPNPDHPTIQHAFEYAFARHAYKPCLGTRSNNGAGPYSWKTYGEIKQLSTFFGSGIIDMCPTQNVDGDSFRFVGINAKNREEWLVLDIACIFYGITVVPFYDTLGPDTVTYILSQTEMQTLMCSEDIVPKLIELKAKGEAGVLQNVIQMEPLTEERREELTSVGYTAYCYDEIIAIGRSSVKKYGTSSPGNVYCFSYTSGTTGDPKGAMITHANMMSTLAAAETMATFGAEVHLSYLPLPHVFEKIIYTGILYHGGRIGFYQGNTLKIKEDLAELRPTVFPSVPRLWSRMYDVIQATFKEAEGTKAKLIKSALETKLKNLRKNGKTTHALWDSLVFKKTAKVLGGRVKLMVTGSAPISGEVLDFLKVCFCAPILEGYGQTESGGVSTATWPNDPNSGHVGGPVTSQEIKLVDIPDMNYTSNDIVEGVPTPRGEICFRGPPVIKGYFKMPEKTAEAIDSDGWLHSGDVGMICPDGSIKIIDRKKNIFKLSQGEYVAPEKIENIMTQLPIVGQCYVHGDSTEAYVVGVIVPDESAAKKWAAGVGIEGDYEHL